ncbi:precorrin-3B synthase, partial [Rhodococcus sp. CC-R104]|nr:precorrin-3B synthase [Rhodococcus sp. CC-R104]
TVLGFDDGTGDIAALTPDLAAVALPDDRWRLLRRGHDTGLRVETGELVDTMLAAVHTPTPSPGGVPAQLPAPPAPPIGWLDQRDGAVTLAGGLRDGELPARTAEFLAAVDRPLLITPWRSVLLCDLDEWTAEQVVRVLAPMGVIFDAQSPHLH